MNISDELIEQLKKTAKTEIGPDEDDDFNPADYSGGNFDDAYGLGVEHGEVYAARSILDKLGVEY